MVIFRIVFPSGNHTHTQMCRESNAGMSRMHEVNSSELQKTDGWMDHADPGDWQRMAVHVGTSVFCPRLCLL